MSNHLPRRIVSQSRPSAPTVRDPDSAVNPANRSIATTDGTVHKYVPAADSKPPNKPETLESSSGHIHPESAHEHWEKAVDP